MEKDKSRAPRGVFGKYVGEEVKLKEISTSLRDFMRRFLLDQRKSKLCE